MSAVSSYSSAVWAVVQRDLRIFLSYRFRALTQLSGLVLTMLIFYYVSRLVDVGQFGSPDEYFAFVVAGLLILNVLQAAIATPPLLRQELIAGTFERILISPLGAVGGVGAMMLFPIAFATVIAIAGFLVASAVFGLPVQWSTAPLAIPVAVLGALAFATIGAFIVALVIVFKQVLGVSWLLALLSLTGGVYFPVALLPEWLAWISAVQPFTPAVDLLRSLLIGTDAAGPPGFALLKLVGFVVVLVPLSALALRYAVRAGRRRGTILEY